MHNDHRDPDKLGYVIRSYNSRPSHLRSIRGKTKGNIKSQVATMTKRIVIILKNAVLCMIQRKVYLLH